MCRCSHFAGAQLCRVFIVNPSREIMPGTRPPVLACGRPPGHLKWAFFLFMGTTWPLLDALFALFPSFVMGGGASTKGNSGTHICTCGGARIQLGALPLMWSPVVVPAPAPVPAALGFCGLNYRRLAKNWNLPSLFHSVSHLPPSPRIPCSFVHCSAATPSTLPADFFRRLARFNGALKNVCQLHAKRFSFLLICQRIFEAVERVRNVVKIFTGCHAIC